MAEETQEKLAVLNGLAGNFAAALSPETARMWLFLLKEYSALEVQAAALALIRRCGSDVVPYRTMPPFALMQKELDAQTGRVSGEENVHLQARAEWDALLRAVRRWGAWREPELEPATACAVHALGGWEQVCRWKMDELPWRERDFLRLWEQSRGREDTLGLGCRAVARLAGPQSVGDLARARLGERAARPEQAPGKRLKSIETAGTRELRP